MKKVKNNYIDNEKFQQEIEKYKAACEEASKQNKEKPRIPEYLGSCLLLIATNYAVKHRFNGYSFKEDMISEAVITCVKYFDNYDLKRGNPLAYFTSIVHYAFFQFINAEERIRYKTLKHFTHSLLIGNEDELFSSNLLNSEELYDNMYTFMKSYEDREETKKKKRKVNGLSKIMKEKKNGESKTKNQS